MRRFVLLAACAAAAAPLFVLAASCAESEDAQPPPPAADGGGLDASLLGEAEPPPVPATDADVPPGDVCGDRRGLNVGSAWPLRGGCPTRAGWSALAGPQTSSVVWSLTDVPAGETSPAVSGGSSIIWVGTADGDVLAVDNGGKGRWSHRIAGAVRSSVALDGDNNAVVGGADGVLYGIKPGGAPISTTDAGLELDSGLLYPPALVAWKLTLAPMASSPVIGSDGTIYVGLLDGHLAAVAPRGESIRWSAATSDTGGSSPAIGQDGTIYVGSTDRKLYAFHPDGTAAFALDLGAEVKGSPAVGGDGTVYVGSMDGKLHAVSREGVLRWSYATGGPITGTPAVYAGVVYVGSEDKKLHAVSVVTGARRFTYDALGAVGTPVIGSDGTVYVGATDARLYAISPKGTLLFSVNVRGRVKGAPAIVAGQALYVATDNGVVLIQP